MRHTVLLVGLLAAFAFMGVRSESALAGPVMLAEGGGLGGSLEESKPAIEHAKPPAGQAAAPHRAPAPRVIIKREVIYLPRPVARSAVPARCTVTDPTGTPLNVRSQPNGPIVGTLNNGNTVERKQTISDNRGRPWSYVVPTGSVGAGWIFREFVTCI